MLPVNPFEVSKLVQNAIQKSVETDDIRISYDKLLNVRDVIIASNEKLIQLCEIGNELDIHMFIMINSYSLFFDYRNRLAYKIILQKLPSIAQFMVDTIKIGDLSQFEKLINLDKILNNEKKRIKFKNLSKLNTKRFQMLLIAGSYLNNYRIIEMLLKARKNVKIEDKIKDMSVVSVASAYSNNKITFKYAWKELVKNANNALYNPYLLYVLRHCACSSSNDIFNDVLKKIDKKLIIDRISRNSVFIDIEGFVKIPERFDIIVASLCAKNQTDDKLVMFLKYIFPNNIELDRDYIFPIYYACKYGHHNIANYMILNCIIDDIDAIILWNNLEKMHIDKYYVDNILISNVLTMVE